MIKLNIKNKKGITLVTLAIAIAIMMIITSTLIYNTTTGSKVRNLNNMYQDITKIKDKVDLYYANHHTIPVLETKYENVIQLQGLNPNDSSTYYVVDLEALENLNLTYGQSYYVYKANPLNEFTDLYVINERSHSIYYVKGISFEDKMYYTIPEENTEVTTNSVLSVEVIENNKNNASIKVYAVDKANGIKKITLMINDEAVKIYEYTSGIREIKSEIAQVLLTEEENICYIQIEDETGNIQNSDNITIKQTVIWLSDANGNNIPVPFGFSPITTEDQGTEETGFVIKNDDDGNEFVWVPCTIDGANGSIKYDRYAFSRDGWIATQTLNSRTEEITRADFPEYVFTEAMQKDEKISVEIYGGFYIGRYETGITGYTSVDTSTSNTLTEYTSYTGGKAIIQSKQQVWNYITRDKAKKVVEALYKKSNGDNVNSKLCSSYAWDTTLKFIETKYSTYPTDSTQGNYSDKSNTLGKPAKTGLTEAVNNIYDMGGNVYEWTTEAFSEEGRTYVTRGANYDVSSSIAPAAGRYSATTVTANNYVSFRTTMYL